MRGSHRQAGVALITALLVVAIATVAAVQIMSRQQLDIRRSQNAMARDQAYAYALGAEAGAIALLKSDLMAGTGDNLAEAWAQPQLLEFEGARLILQIEDLQGRFDLNSLADLPQAPRQAQAELAYQRFRTLLENVAQTDPDAIEGAPFDPDALIQALADWMDPDLAPRPPFGAEDGYYLGLERPYRTSNQHLASASELMLVKGYTPELVAAIAPYVTALPGSGAGAGAINVNTAKPQVLRALDRRISQDMAEQLVEQAAKQPWPNPQAFVQDPALRNLALKPDGLSTDSHYFLADSRVSLDRASVPLRSLIRRGNDKSLKVLSRGRGMP